MNTSAIKDFRKRNGITLEEFGRMLSPAINKSTVLRWERRVPAERVLDIEKVTGISRHKLRPDVFGARAPRRPRAKT